MKRIRGSTRVVKGAVVTGMALALSFLLSLGTPLASEPLLASEPPLTSESLPAESRTPALKTVVGAQVPEAADTQGGEPLRSVLPCRFLDARGFSFMLSRLDATEVPSWRTRHPVLDSLPEPVRKEPLQGLVLPHHDVASPMTARILAEASTVFLEQFPEQQPETIILLGPNHERSGDARIQTFFADWETPVGIFPLAQDWHDVLVREFGAAGEVSLMEREHSLAYLIPWLHHAFPDASVLPVLIHGNLDRKGCERLSATLAAFAQERHTMVIASVDFSHGLTPERALAADETTWQYVKSGTVSRVFGLDNGYLDAPPTLATMMLTMSALDAGVPYLSGHAEASLFLGKPVDDTTSYLCIAYPQKQARTTAGN